MSFKLLKFQCGLCNESCNGACVRHLNVRIGEHIGIPLLTKKQVKLKNSSVADHLLFCNHSASYDGFSILALENKKFLLELKKSLSIIRDQPFLNRNITYFIGPSKKIFVRILFVFNSCYNIFIEWTFYYFLISKCLSTTVRVSGSVQFTFFLVMRLNITTVTSCDSLIVILLP